jgi:hypothetical protein
VLTDAGRNLRQAVEAQTDANFFGPWTDLPPNEIDDLAARARAIIIGLV